MSIENFNKIKDLVKNDEDLSSMNGGILYSSIDTLREGEFYFLGVNPGGENAINILDNLEENKNKNAFIDEAWSNKTKDYNSGDAPMQKRAKELFEKLGSDIKDVCSSNLIFNQSVDEKSLDGKLFDNANICWKVHELLINEIIKPKYIISHGGTVYNYFVAKKEFKPIEIFNSGHGDWSIKIAKKDDITLINLPHLSYYAPFTKGNEKKKEAMDKLFEIVKYL